MAGVVDGVVDGVFGDVFSDVRGAVLSLERVLRDLEPGCLDGAGATRLVELFARAERLSAAGKALVSRRVGVTGAWKGDGHRSVAHWMAAATGVTVGAASQALSTADALDELPATAVAFRAGQLSEVQAREITAAASADPSAEARLLAAAQASSVKGLRDRCREVCATAVDDVEAARRLHESRRVHEWTDRDGAYRLDVRLMPDRDTAAFRSALHAHTDRIFREAHRAGRREPRAAYMADALVRLAREGPCKAPDVKVVADHTALARGYAEPGERCEITGLGPVPVALVRAMMNDARISLLARDRGSAAGGGEVRSVGRPRRSISARTRRELEVLIPSAGSSGVMSTSSSRSTTSTRSPPVATRSARTSGGSACTTTGSRPMRAGRWRALRGGGRW